MTPMHPRTTDASPSGTSATINIHKLHITLVTITTVFLFVNLINGIAMMQPHKQTQPLATTLIKMSPDRKLMYWAIP